MCPVRSSSGSNSTNRRTPTAIESTSIRFRYTGAAARRGLTEPARRLSPVKATRVPSISPKSPSAHQVCPGKMRVSRQNASVSANSAASRSGTAMGIPRSASRWSPWH